MDLARLVGALAGLPETAEGVTVNRFCASSLQAVNMAAQNIMLGYGDFRGRRSRASRACP